MLCAISGEAPQVPVASKKSGNVFERRLIESYISENGTDPINNEELTTDDLIDLKSSRIIRPRPPTLTSIPSLLSTFQNEWDALALETFTLRQQLVQTRQELSTALYQNDAAIRVIARLSKERDEARDALSKITMNGGSASHGEIMQVDSEPLSEGLISKIEATQEMLSKTRRKRAIPENWASSEEVQSLTPQTLSSPLHPGGSAVAIDASGDLLLTGGADGNATVFSISAREPLQTLEGGSGSITDVAWNRSVAITASSTGTIKFFENGDETTRFSRHAGEVTAIAVHPSGDILATVGVDKSFVLYDLTLLTVATQVYTDSGLTTAAFHPDGQLFAAGGVDGNIRIFDVKSLSLAANFDAAGPIRSLCFSENGTWLAVAVKGETGVQIWDLRKAAQIKTIEIGTEIKSVRWDYTGQYLLTAGPSGLTVQQYSKSTKEWSEPLRNSFESLFATWGPQALSLISLRTDGTLIMLDEP